MWATKAVFYGMYLLAIRIDDFYCWYNLRSTMIFSKYQPVRKLRKYFYFGWTTFSIRRRTYFLIKNFIKTQETIKLITSIRCTLPVCLRQHSNFLFCISLINTDWMLWLGRFIIFIKMNNDWMNMKF